MGSHHPRDRRWAHGLSLALSVVALGGCGSLVSLDTPSPTSTGADGPASTGSTSSTASTGTTEPMSTSEDTATTDPQRPPPGVCPEDCTVALNEIWTWPPEPMAPEPPPDERRITAMIGTPNGQVIIAERRDGTSWLTRIAPNGGLLWSIPAEYSCNCEIVSLAMTPDDQLLVAGVGEFFGGGPPVVAIASYNIFNPSLLWVGWEQPFSFVDHEPRVGSVLSLPEGRVGVLMVEPDIYGNPETNEAMGLLEFDQGVFWGRDYIDSQPYGDRPWRPRGHATPDGGVVVAFNDSTGGSDAGYLAWLEAFSHDPTVVEPLPGPPDALAFGDQWDALVAGHEVLSPEEIEIHVSRSQSGLPFEWARTETITTTQPSAPVIALDGNGGAIVALRVVPEPEGEAMVWLGRWDESGDPLWSSTVPLAADPSEHPVFLAVDGNEDLTLAATVDGEIHLQRRRQECQCE